MLVVGITGPIGHGKSTLAETLLARVKNSVHLETSMIISDISNEWLDSLPDELIQNPYDLGLLNLWVAALAEVVSSKLTSVDLKDLEIKESDLKKHPEDYEKLFMFLDHIKQGMIKAGVEINESNKDRYRAILQWVGGYLVKKIDKSIWFSEVERQLKEAEAAGKDLFLVGGIRFPNDAEIIRKNKGVIIQLMRTGLIARDSGDYTERFRSKIHVDVNILSDANKKAVVEASNAIYDDLVAGRLLSEYRTSDFAF